MKKRRVLRGISLVMMGIAAVFVFCALSCPTLGSTFYLGGIAIGAEVWRVFCVLYVLIMAGLFAASFLAGRGGKDR